MSNQSNFSAIGALQATVGIGQYIVNDYVLTLEPLETGDGYTLTIRKGSDVQTVTLEGLSEENLEIFRGYVAAAQAAQLAAEGAQTAAETAQGNAEDAQAAAEAAQSLAETAQAAAETAETNAGASATQAGTSASSAAQSATQAAGSAAAAAQTLTDVQAAGQAQIAAIGAEGERVLETIPEDYTELSDDVSDLKTSVSEKPSVMESDADDVDLDITDSDGYVLGRFSDGHFQTKNFDSRDISGADASTVEIDLSTQNVVNFNLEYGNDWRSSSTYRGVLIPKSALKDTVTFDADENKLIFAFLKDNNITNNFPANVCSGTTVGRISAHSVITTIVPDDCEYLYVYISDGSFIGTISVYTTVSATGITTEINNLRGEIDALKNQTGAYYITDAEQILLSLKRRYAGAPRNFTDLIAGDDLMLISHISDLHNDPDSYENYISFFNDNIDLIDCAVVTGDIVDSTTTSAYAEMTALDANIPSGAKFLKVVGNHDRGSASLSDVFTSMNMSVSTSGETLYYVTDFADKNIRIIVLNQYDNTSQYANATAHYSQTQIDWFISKLSEAAANGYQVIVCYHSCNEMGFPAYNTKGFCQTVYYEEEESVTDGTIIADIINAFQTGGSLSETYTSSDTGDTLTVSTTFSTPGVFVCYLCGHEHVDYIGYSKVYPNQLVCMVQGAVINSTTRPNGNWQSHYDTPRVADTSTENSINVYAIDTSSRLVKVAKFGSTVTDKLMPRSLATFGY